MFTEKHQSAKKKKNENYDHHKIIKADSLFYRASREGLETAPPRNQ